MSDSEIRFLIGLCAFLLLFAAPLIAAHIGKADSPDAMSEADQRQAVLHSLRGHFASFGHDTSDLSDDEFESLLLRAGRQLGTAGVTTDQAVRALALFGSMGKAGGEERLVTPPGS